jgi:hypothetical protein
MQVLMSFLETRPTKFVEPVWPTLDPADRDEIVTALARLIAKAVVRNEVGADEEARDE